MLRFLIFALLGFIVYKTFFKPTRKSYKGKVVLITGASSGIGEELAFQFAKEGAKLVLAARRTDRLQGVVEKCKSLGGDAISVQTDVSKQDQCKTMIEQTVRHFGTLDVLVLNAGRGCLLRMDELTAESTPAVRDVFEVNYWGSVYPTQYALPHLRKSKGTVVAISSLASKFPTPRRTIYASTKAALNAFCNCLRVEEPDIQVTVICPGFVISEIHENAVTAKPVEREKSNFMSTEECARIIITAAAEGRREEIMTPLGKLGAYLLVFMPWVVDELGRRKAEASVKQKSQ